MTAICGHPRVTLKTAKLQFTTYRIKTPETPAEASLSLAVEELAVSGEYIGRQGFHDLVKFACRRFVEAALLGVLDARLKEESRMMESFLAADEEDDFLPIHIWSGSCLQIRTSRQWSQRSDHRHVRRRYKDPDIGPLGMSITACGQ